MARVRIQNQEPETKGIAETKIEQSRKWFLEKTKAIGKKATGSNVALKEGRRKDIRPTPGMMYAFYYDPKHKETLPYYDTYPLVVIVELNSKGILGLNLH